MNPNETSTPDPAHGHPIRVSVTQDENGNCTVIEHDLARGFHRVSAKFPAERRTVRVNEGKDEAERDVAQVRALTYAQTIELLVNEGTVDLG